MRLGVNTVDTTIQIGHLDLLLVDTLHIAFYNPRSPQNFDSLGINSVTTQIATHTLCTRCALHQKRWVTAEYLGILYDQQYSVILHSFLYSTASIIWLVGST